MKIILSKKDIVPLLERAINSDLYVTVDVSCKRNQLPSVMVNVTFLELLNKALSVNLSDYDVKILPDTPKKEMQIILDNLISLDLPKEDEPVEAPADIFTTAAQQAEADDIAPDPADAGNSDSEDHDDGPSISELLDMSRQMGMRE